MNKEEIVAALKSHLTGVPELKKLSYANNEFPRWKNSVLKTITEIYGKESPQYRRFEEAPGQFFKVDTELGRQQTYTYVLEMHESALESLVQQEEMG